MKFKSKFEAQFHKTYGQSLMGYELDRYAYTIQHQYTPDWKVSDHCFIETKGRWLSSDRTKITAVVKQNPGLIVAMVFMEPNKKISSSSKTSYADYCDKKGIIWFDIKNKAGIDSFIKANK